MNREVCVLQDKEGEDKVKSLTNRKTIKSLLKGLATCALVLCVFGMASLGAFAAEGEIIAETAKIRAQASTSSDVVGSTVKGKKIDILEVVQDSSGVKWYKVSVAGGSYGYIREDLVKTSENLTATSTVTATTTQQTSSSAQQPADTVPTAIGEQSAVIKCESNATIRSGASTSHAKVTSLPNGTPITLIGEATDSGGNKWYQMTCNYNNRSIEGYIRSDLITIGAAAGEGEGGENPEGEAPAEGENPEGENPEEGAPEEPEQTPEDSHRDYEIRWAQNQDNEDYDYFLYDNLAGNRMRLSEVLNAVTVSNESIQKLESEAERNKIIIIVLAGVIVLLFVIITVMIFKIRSLYYEDYDEEDDDEEEEEEEVPLRRRVKKKVPEEEEEEPAPMRKKRPAQPREEAVSRREGQARREGQNRKEGERQMRKTAEPELRAAEKKENVKRPATRKPQNFLVDDDEFEFEFLNMDDKDL